MSAILVNDSGLSKSKLKVKLTMDTFLTSQFIVRIALITVSAAALNSCKEDFASKGEHAYFGSHKNYNPLTDQDEIVHN